MPVHVSTLPPFSNQHGGCPHCGRRYELWVKFDRGCPLVVGGEHYHRECSACGHRWIERASPRASLPERTAED